METVLLCVYHDWDVSIHCSPTHGGLYRSVACVRAPLPFGFDGAAARRDPPTVLDTPRSFYPSVALSNAAALASARRFIEHEEVPRIVH